MGARGATRRIEQGGMSVKSGRGNAKFGALTVGSRLAHALGLSWTSKSSRPMRPPRLLAVFTLATLASMAACGEPGGPTTPQGTITQPPPTAQPSTPSTPNAPIDQVLLSFGGSGLLAVAGDSLMLSGEVHRGSSETLETLVWETSDPSITSIEAVETNLVRLRTHRSGAVTIAARTRSALPELSRRLVLEVLARSEKASPIVVDEFALVYAPSANPRLSLHMPRVRLRDTSIAGTARVIGISVDVPQLGNAVFCSTDRIIDAVGWSAFNPPGDMNYGFFLTPKSSAWNGAPTLRVIAQFKDGLAVSSSVTGQTVLDPTWKWYEGDDTGVRCQL